VEVIKKVLVAAEQKKVLQDQTVLLNQRIEGLNKIIVTLNEKDSASIALYEEQVEAMKAQKEIYQSQLDSYEKLLRKEKRKRFWTGALGMATTAAMGYMFISK
jgi:ASC-1-like (ASCH) protein